ncbi:MAG: aminoacyl-histidine dipeptidase [Paludibacteraceae bacterium]|nr:aminoacyl-histidine dipeptidase [Paludibacteraceae bacterium]
MITLQPQQVWKCFHSLTQIPRPSGKRKEIADFLAGYGRSLGLETFQDEIGNVFIRKPASPGYEDHPGVILQGHMDMVPQKDSGKVFDFEKDPIETLVDGGWVHANGTTLGADNGMGVAAAMAVLADNTLEHPALEAFFTVDEETGMYGAEALQAGVLQGKTLLNLDCEVEGELYIGCAGGVDATAVFHYEPVAVPEGDVALQITLSGLHGGHSGCDIHLQRANAIKKLFEFLKEAVSEYEARLACVQGGSLRNAIPREATALITVPAEGKEELLELVDFYEDLFIKTYDGIEDNIHLTATDVDIKDVKGLLPEDTQDFLIHAITVCPHGVYRMIPELPDVVETSNCLSIIEQDEKTITVICLTRSSVESRKEEMMEVLDSTFRMAGADITFSGSYPGWKPNTRSHILDTMQAIYQQEFGTTPRVMTIHAGLECGIIGKNYPGMDMISFGPTIAHPHSPSEAVEIESVAKFYHFLLATLKAL